MQVSHSGPVHLSSKEDFVGSNPTTCSIYGDHSSIGQSTRLWFSGLRVRVPLVAPFILRTWYISSAAVSKTALWGCDSLRPCQFLLCLCRPLHSPTKVSSMLLRNWAIIYLKGCVSLGGLRINVYKCIYLLESSGGLVWQKDPIYCTRTRLWLVNPYQVSGKSWMGSAWWCSN